LLLLNSDRFAVTPNETFSVYVPEIVPNLNPQVVSALPLLDRYPLSVAFVSSTPVDAFVTTVGSVAAAADVVK